MLQPKRRSTLDSSQKLKKHKQTEFLFELDKCLQIPNDDKLLIRRLIKQYDSAVISIFEQFRRQKNLHELQMKLRKHLQNHKNQLKRNHTLISDKENYKEHTKMYSQHSQPTSTKNSGKCSPEKESKKKVINLDIALLKQKIENSVSHRPASSTPSQPQEDSLKKRNISINKINAYLPSNWEQPHKHRYHLRTNSKEQEQNASITTLSTRNPSKSKLSTEEKTSKDFSKITIRISSKSNSQASIKNTQSSNTPQSLALDDITNQISYSSSIKNLLTAKIKGQKQHSRKNDKIYIREDVPSEPSEDQRNYMDILTKGKREDKPTIVKRPAKPLHRDQSSCTMKLFDDSIPVFLKTQEESDKKDESKLTVRDKKWYEEEEPNNYSPSFDYSFKQIDNYNPKQTPNSSNFQGQNITEGYFFKKIKRIMEGGHL